ncbi:Gfo/Idh/MocA family protein [Oceanobacillus sp. Castelsardo]|uniref:Gfo/Idh/MocA family protein n=1 Tax=Oceanobacillus sp. Castelsardo TaxID=1851204 RepID=UPI0008384182|nr:Gfo/Idh/MocA family oxidoreductase [Oceanobacillus sp. Castelsardo]
MRVGVIGIGKMGENHVRTYLSLKNHCELVGIYDTDEEKINEIANNYQVKPFHSLNNLLRAVDAVSIAVPTEFHYDVGLSCIKHNVHILMEKPITSTVDEAKELINQAKKAGIKLQVGHIELFNPLIQFLKRELQNEKIIEIMHDRMSPHDDRLKDIDVVKDLMIHDLYILDELLKDRYGELYTVGKVINGIPEHAVTITQSLSGVTAHLTASFKSRKKVRAIKVLTENALFETDILNNVMKISRSIKEDTSNISVPITETIQFDHSIQPLSVQLLDFINCINNDEKPKVPGEDGMKILILTNKISESIIDSNKNK